MVRTSDGADMTASFQQPVTAVAADVLESLELIVLVEYHDDALGGHATGDEITRLIELAAMPGEVPAAIENPLGFEREAFVVESWVMILRDDGCNTLAVHICGSHLVHISG